MHPRKHYKNLKSIADYAVSHLGDLGITKSDVIFAKNGKIAVEKYFSEQPDLVIMDIMMPIMNGFDAFDQIERNSITRVPIIACTAKVIKSENKKSIFNAENYIFTHIPLISKYLNLFSPGTH